RSRRRVARMVPSDQEESADDQGNWPRLPLADWQTTHDTLHMWMQIVGKTRLALSPKQNHWWHVPLYLTSRGLTTTPMPYGARAFEVEFDCVDHRLLVASSDAAARTIALRPQAVADFYREYTETLAGLGMTVNMWPVPVEVDGGIPFLDDRIPAPYDARRANRFFRGILQAGPPLQPLHAALLGQRTPLT